MTLETAIEICQQLKYQLYVHTPIEQLNALQLGIEALKREKQHRQNPGYVRGSLLPGETKE